MRAIHHLSTRRALPRRALPRRCRGPLLGGMRLRWRARRQMVKLDDALAAGADPIESDELSLRAGQLTSIQNRDQLASALERAVELADQQPRATKTAPRPICSAEVRNCRTLLLDLAASVRDAGPYDAQGLAITACLISDSASPLHQGGSTQPLAATVYSALFALGLEQPSR